MFDLKKYDWKKYNWRRYNIFLVFIVIILYSFSMFFVGAALEGESYADSYLKKQLVGLIGCLLIMGVVSLIDYHFICRFALFYYILGVLLAAATKFSPFGRELGTTQYRWIAIGTFNFQPSEICKTILILSLAAFFTKMKEKLDKFSTLVLAGLVMALPTFFILIQSDLSSALVMLFLFAMMVLAAGISYKILMPIILLGIPTIIVGFWYIQQPFQKILNKYQQGRILSFLNPEENSLGGMYQQNNSVLAIASGRVSGKLFMDDVVGAKAYRSVAVNESDFIFSVIGEEVGFIGCCMIIGLLMCVVIICFLTARKAKDYTGMLISIGIASMFVFQIFANIGVATSILPNTGLPLPFLSYGISSMLGTMIAIGIILNIGLQKKTIRG